MTGTCPECHREVALTAFGTLIFHRAGLSRAGWRPTCPGSGVKP